jgi:hypothetical protein
VEEQKPAKLEEIDREDKCDVISLAACINKNFDLPGISIQINCQVHKHWSKTTTYCGLRGLEAHEEISNLRSRSKDTQESSGGLAQTPSRSPSPLSSRLEPRKRQICVSVDDLCLCLQTAPSPKIDTFLSELPSHGQGERWHSNLQYDMRNCPLNAQISKCPWPVAQD